MLIMMPKASLGRRLSATISSEIGMALEMAATPNPTSSTVGDNSAAPACATPTGTATNAAAASPHATECPACRWDTRLPNTM